ncbi:hypothetical protein PHISP_04311 [Aspergillus sp. HF37]|nr:hypothetical protein PHISP_04311 [Aspergillus sp. HF37]
MDSNGDQPTPTPRPPAPASTLPIAQISPSLERLEERSICAVVTLVWPYSSATKFLSLLLAEPDFRLRRLSGQVKVVFHGPVAEKVAKTHVGIGDEVSVSLAGSRLVANNTVGNCVAWDVHFDDRVFLEISRSSKHLSTVKIEPPTEQLPTTDENAVPPSTPQNAGIRLGGTDPTAGLGSWGSPAFSQRSRTSFGGLVDTPFDPFAEEDGFVPGKGRKRPRFSMRSSEWRVIDEPESPGEKEGPIDWMELDAEVSEPEVEDKDLAQDIKAAEIPAAEPPTQVARESSAIAESHYAVPSIQLPSEPDDTDHGQTLEQLAKHATQSAEFPARQVSDNVAAERTLDYFVHPPTDTPRLCPIPSPGLPIPSPLVPSNNPNGYFASSATSTQISHGRFLTVETQTTTTAKGEEVVGSQMEQVPVQVQPPSLETRVESQMGPSYEDFSAPKALGGDIQEPEPTSIDEATEPLHPVNVEPKADAGLFSEDEKDEQAAEYSEKGSVVGEREESDLDQEYSGEDVTPADEEIPPQEGGLSDEGESEEANEDEQELPNQIPGSIDFHGKPQTEVIDLDSDEAEETNSDRELTDGGAEKGEAGPYSTMVDDFNEYNHYPDDEEENEEVDDDIDEDRVESEADEDSEEVENDYGPQNEGPEGYEYGACTEFESEDLDDEEQYQQPPPPKGDPDVIVLDSDSDGVPRPSSHEQPTEQPEQEARGLQEPEPAGLTSDEYSSSADSAAEENLVPVNEEQDAGEQSKEDIVDEKAEDESVEDEAWRTRRKTGVWIVRMWMMHGINLLQHPSLVQRRLQPAKRNQRLLVKQGHMKKQASYGSLT